MCKINVIRTNLHFWNFFFFFNYKFNLSPSQNISNMPIFISKLILSFVYNFDILLTLMTRLWVCPRHRKRPSCYGGPEGGWGVGDLPRWGLSNPWGMRRGSALSIAWCHHPPGITAHAQREKTTLTKRSGIPTDWERGRGGAAETRSIAPVGDFQSHLEVKF